MFNRREKVPKRKEKKCACSFHLFFRENEEEENDIHDLSIGFVRASEERKVEREMYAFPFSPPSYERNLRVEKNHIPFEL